jgi:proline racemase
VRASGNPAIEGVSIVQIAAPWQGIGEVTKNAVVVAPGRLDRSATGTGSPPAWRFFMPAG